MANYTLLKITAFLLLFSPYSYSSTIKPGDLLISEVMSNPMAVSDTNGEWFEVFNASTQNIDLNGFVISDNGSNLHEISNTGSLLIQPGDYFVFGRNGDSNSNGGYIADYVYTNFTLGNSSDQIILSDNNMEIVRLDYSGANFGAAGISAELILQTSSPVSADYQLTQNFNYGLGDIGTPGTTGTLSLSSANPVPIPGAIWLFLSAIGLLLPRRKLNNYSVSNIIDPIRKYLTSRFSPRIINKLS